MSYGMWLSAAGMQANDYRLDLISNNVANASTVGFKHDVALIQERSVEATEKGGGRFRNVLMDRLSGGLGIEPTHHAFVQGALESTGRALDVAIEGDGFFRVQDGGAMRYTRDGRLMASTDNELVLVAGGGRTKVLDEAGAPITLQADSTEPPVIEADGTVRQGNAIVGRIGVVEFANTDQLQKVGGGLYRSENELPQPSNRSALRPGMVEQSTVSPVQGLADLIEASRAFELNASMVTMQDTATGQAVSRLGNVG